MTASSDFPAGVLTGDAVSELFALAKQRGFALPAAFKPVLVVAEFFVIATILIVTQTGNRAQWHRRWGTG